MYLEGDAAAGAGNPAEGVEVATEVGGEGAGLRHRLAVQVGLGREERDGGGRHRGR